MAELDYFEDVGYLASSIYVASQYFYFSMAWMEMLSEVGEWKISIFLYITWIRLISFFPV